MHLTGGLGRRRHAGCCRAESADGDDRAPGRPARQVHRSATPGASAGSASAGTAHRLIGHDGNTIGQAAFLRILPGGRGLAVTLLTNGGNTRDLYEDLYREIFAELAGVAMPHAVRAAGRAGRGRHHAVRRHLRAGRRSAWRSSPATDGPRLRTTVTGPLAELVPDPVEEYAAGPGRPGAVRGQAARGGDLGAGHVLRPADRRAVPALRRARHAEGGLTMDRPDLAVSRSLADLARAGRVRVAVGRPRRGRPLGRGRRPARHARASASSRSGSSSTAAPTCAGGSAPARPGAAARPPRHGVAARLAGDPPVRRSRTGCCAGPAAST